MTTSSSSSAPGIGTRGMSASVDTLIRRQRERDRLRELIESAEAEHGPVDRAAVEAKRVILRGGTVSSADAAPQSPGPTGRAPGGDATTSGPGAPRRPPSAL